jgi:ferredoxin
MKASIERDGCIACGVCVEVCPQVFYFADDGLADVKAEVTKDTQEMAIEARDSCPVSVINIED